jgi:TPR repeat protein
MRRDLIAIIVAVLAGVCDSASAESPDVKTARMACEAGDMNECYRLADLYRKGSSGDVKKAAALYKKVCDAGKLSACLDLAQMYEDGDGVKQDRVMALALRQKLCDGGDGKVCMQLAHDDSGHAAAHFEEACKTGDSKGCYNGGQAWSRGSQGASNDMTKAVGLYQKGCDAGYLPACYNGGVALVEGQGVAKDSARAAALFTKACETKTTEKPEKGLEQVQPRACHNLAIQYQHGDGVKLNMVRARQLFEIACKADMPEACHAADTAKTLEKHPEETAAGAGSGVALYLLKYCDDGAAYACRTIAENFMAGTGQPKNPARASEYFKRANTLNTAQCDKGGKDAPMACMELSRAYEAGTGVAKDPLKSAALVKKANGLSQIECDKGSLDECATLGLAYQWGNGLPKDVVRAAALFKKACDGGSKFGCNQQKELAQELAKKP